MTSRLFDLVFLLQLYFQTEQDEGAQSTRLRAIADLFCNIAEEPCFNQLRSLYIAFLRSDFMLLCETCIKGFLKFSVLLSDLCNVLLPAINYIEQRSSSAIPLTVARG